MIGRGARTVVDMGSVFSRLAQKLEKTAQLHHFTALLRTGMEPEQAVLRAAEATSAGTASRWVGRIASDLARGGGVGSSALLQGTLNNFASAGAWADNLVAISKNPKQTARIVVAWKLLQDAIDRQEGGPKVGQTRAPEPPQVALLPRIVDVAKAASELNVTSALRKVVAPSSYFTPRDLALSEQLGLSIAVMAKAGASPETIMALLGQYAEVRPATGIGAEPMGPGETLFEVTGLDGEPQLVTVKLTPDGKRRIQEDIQGGLPAPVGAAMGEGVSASVGAAGKYVRPLLRLTARYGSPEQKRAILQALPYIDWGEAEVSPEANLKAASGR
jgi:hypothetical protein